MVILTESEKDVALNKLIDDINKKYGQGALVRGTDARGLKIKRLRTGSIALDVALGGGWAFGKLNEIFGAFSSAKSYIAQLTMAQTQRTYPNANIALIDFEGAFDAEWATKIGVDVNKLLISSPEYMEDGLQIALDLIHSQDCALIVIDSWAAACPKAEYDGDITEFTVGLRARIGNKFVRKSKTKTNLTEEDIDLGQTTILVVNQTYKNIGVSYGDPDVTPGGEQLKFGSMIRVKTRRGELVTDPVDGTLLMQETRFTVVKNKTYPPHKTGAFWFSTRDNPKGKAGEIYKVGEILTQGVLLGIIERSGGWYKLPEAIGGDKLHGEKAMSEWVVDNPEGYIKLEDIILRSIYKE